MKIKFIKNSKMQEGLFSKKPPKETEASNNLNALNRQRAENTFNERYNIAHKTLRQTLSSVKDTQISGVIFSKLFPDIRKSLPFFMAEEDVFQNGLELIKEKYDLLREEYFKNKIDKDVVSGSSREKELQSIYVHKLSALKSMMMVAVRLLKVQSGQLKEAQESLDWDIGARIADIENLAKTMNIKDLFDRSKTKEELEKTPQQQAAPEQKAEPEAKNPAEVEDQPVSYDYLKRLFEEIQKHTQKFGFDKNFDEFLASMEIPKDAIEDQEHADYFNEMKQILQEDLRTLLEGEAALNQLKTQNSADYGDKKLDDFIAGKNLQDEINALKEKLSGVQGTADNEYNLYDSMSAIWETIQAQIQTDGYDQSFDEYLKQENITRQDIQDPDNLEYFKEMQMALEQDFGTVTQSKQILDKLKNEFPDQFGNYNLSEICKIKGGLEEASEYLKTLQEKINNPDVTVPPASTDTTTDQTVTAATPAPAAPVVSPPATAAPVVSPPAPAAAPVVSPPAPAAPAATAAPETVAAPAATAEPVSAENEKEAAILDLLQNKKQASPLEIINSIGDVLKLPSNPSRRFVELNDLLQPLIDSGKIKVDTKKAKGREQKIYSLPSPQAAETTPEVQPTVVVPPNPQFAATTAPAADNQAQYLSVKDPRILEYIKQRVPGISDDNAYMISFAAISELSDQETAESLLVLNQAGMTGATPLIRKLNVEIEKLKGSQQALQEINRTLKKVSNTVSSLLYEEKKFNEELKRKVILENKEQRDFVINMKRLAGIK